MKMVSPGGSGGHFPKWQLAIALGTTGALGLGYWYLNRSNSSHSDRKSKFKKSIGDKSISIDAGGDSDKPSLTPLEKAQEYKTEGNTAFRSGKYDEAISYYNQAIEACPIDMKIDLATFYQNRAAAYEQLKKWSSVKEDCSKALQLNPNYLKALYRRAKASEITNDFVQALEDITAVCLMEKFQNQTTLFMADRVLKQLGAKHAKEEMSSRKPVMPSKQFIKIYFAAFTEDPVLKHSENDSFIPSSEEHTGYARALIALRNNNYEEVIGACTEEVDSSESEAQYKSEALVLRATFYLLVGRQQDAVTDLQAVINNKDVDVKLRVNALIKLAALNMQLEKPDSSMQNFEQAAKLDPQNCDVYQHRAQYHLLHGNVNEAAIDFKKAIELNPNYAIAHAQKCYTEYRLALGNMDLEKLKSVMEDFQQAINKFPNCCECYSLYAQVLTDQHKFEEADQFFVKTMEADPDNATVYVQRAVLHLQWTSDIDKSIELINTALEKDAKCEYAYEALGSIEVQRGNLKRAVELFDQAISLAKTETEMTHLFSLKDAAIAQRSIAEKMGLARV